MTQQTDDIVQRLRKEAGPYITEHGGPVAGPEGWELELLCNEAADTIERLQADLSRTREALRELVACKDLKDRIEAADLSLYDMADAERANAMQDEYDRRKPLAWQQARALVSPTTAPTGEQHAPENG